MCISSFIFIIIINVSRYHTILTFSYLLFPSSFLKLLLQEHIAYRTYRVSMSRVIYKRVNITRQRADKVITVFLTVLPRTRVIKCLPIYTIYLYIRYVCGLSFRDDNN